jgi:hypothetical protein
MLTKTYKIFSTDILSEIINNYYEIPRYNEYEKNNEYDCKQIFNSLDDFIPLKSDYFLKNVPTDLGEVPIMVKYWKNEFTKLEFLITKGKGFIGYSIIFSTQNDFIILGNSNLHPFIITHDISYWWVSTENHDLYEEDFAHLDFLHIKNLLKIKFKEYYITYEFE